MNAITPTNTAPPISKSKKTTTTDKLTAAMSNMAIQATPQVPPIAPPYFQEFLGYYNRFYPDKPAYKTSPPQDTKVHLLTDVGDSDADCSDSGHVGKHRVKTPIKASATTVYSQKKRIKGDALIAKCQTWAQDAIADAKKLGPITKKSTYYRIHSTDDWLRSAGHMVVQPSNDMVTATTFFTDLSVGRSKTLLTLKKEGATERLHFPASLLQKIQETQTPPTKTDLSCKEIVETTNKRIAALETTDKKYAKWQLARLRGESGPDKTTDRQWLDCMNTWIFGVEASRNNATFITGVMTLELIAAGEMTYKQAFSENKYGGQFPMATILSGSGNMTARRKLIEHADNDKSVGMKTDRIHPQWLAISLKEAILIKKWLIYFEHADRTMSRNTILDNYKKAVTTLLSTHFGDPTP